MMTNLNAKEKVRVMREVGKRYSSEVSKAWSRGEYNAKLDEIARELFGSAEERAKARELAIRLSCGEGEI